MNNLPFNLPQITAFRELDYTLRLNIDLSFLTDPEITFQVWDGNIILYQFAGTYNAGLKRITGVFQVEIVRKMPALCMHYILIDGLHKLGGKFTTSLNAGDTSSNTLDVEISGDTYVTVEIPGHILIPEAIAKGEEFTEFKSDVSEVSYKGAPFAIGASDALSTYTSSTAFNLRMMAFSQSTAGFVNRIDLWAVKAGVLNLRVFRDNKNGTFKLIQKSPITINLGANTITTGFAPFYIDQDIRVGVFYNSTSGLIGYKAKTAGSSFGAASPVDINVGDDVALSASSTAEFGIVLYINPALGRAIKKTSLPSEISDVVSFNAFNRGRSEKIYSPRKYGILIAGQSNTDAAIPYAQIPSWFITAGRLIPGVNFSKNPSTTFSTYTVSSGADWAYDLFLYKSLIDYLRIKNSDPTYELYVIKQSIPGTSISVDAKPTSPGYWDVNFEKIPSNKPAITKEWEKRIRTILNAVSAFDVRCVVWHQGEADQGDPDTYYQNLKNLIWYVRGVLNMPKLLWVLGGINTSSTSFNQTVQNAKIKIASEDPYVKYVPVANGTSYLNPDSLHWNATGAQEFSDKVFEIIKDIEPSTNLNGGFY